MMVPAHWLAHTFATSRRLPVQPGVVPDGSQAAPAWAHALDVAQRAIAQDGAAPQPLPPPGPARPAPAPAVPGPRALPAPAADAGAVPLAQACRAVAPIRGTVSAAGTVPADSAAPVVALQAAPPRAGALALRPAGPAPGPMPTALRPPPAAAPGHAAPVLQVHAQLQPQGWCVWLGLPAVGAEGAPAARDLLPAVRAALPAGHPVAALVCNGQRVPIATEEPPWI